jgi:hypothetical protein
MYICSNVTAILSGIMSQAADALWPHTKTWRCCGSPPPLIFLTERYLVSIKNEGYPVLLTCTMLRSHLPRKAPFHIKLRNPSLCKVLSIKLLEDLQNNSSGNKFVIVRLFAWEFINSVGNVMGGAVIYFVKYVNVPRPDISGLHDEWFSSLPKRDIWIFLFTAQKDYGRNLILTECALWHAGSWHRDVGLIHFVKTSWLFHIRKQRLYVCVWQWFHSL